MRLFIIILFLANLIICCFYIDFDRNDNTASRAYTVIAYYEGGSFAIDKYQQNTIDKCYINNHYYSEKAPLPAMAVIPIYILLKKLNINNIIHNDFKLCLVIGDIIGGVLPFIIIILLTFLNIYKLKSPVSAVLLCMLPFYGSFLYIYSGTFFAHLFGGMLLLGAYIFLKRNSFLFSGLLTGLCILSEFPLAIVIPIWTIQIFYNTKKVKDSFIYLTGVIPSIIFIAFYNYHFTGSAFKMLYTYYNNTFPEMSNNLGFAAPSLKALWGLIFSQYRGLLFYLPVLIIILYYTIVNFKKEYVSGILSNYLILFVILYIIVLSSFVNWNGGWTYGPRYLTAIAILISYEGITYLSKHKISKPFFRIITGLGLICSILAKSTVTYSNPTEMHNPIFQSIIPNFIKHNFNQNNILTALFGLNAGYAVIVWLIMFIVSVYLLSYYYKRISINLAS